MYYQNSALSVKLLNKCQRTEEKNIFARIAILSSAKGDFTDIQTSNDSFPRLILSIEEEIHEIANSMSYSQELFNEDKTTRFSITKDSESISSFT